MIKTFIMFIFNYDLVRKIIVIIVLSFIGLIYITYCNHNDYFTKININLSCLFVCLTSLPTSITNN